MWIARVVGAVFFYQQELHLMKATVTISTLTLYKDKKNLNKTLLTYFTDTRLPA